MAVESGTGAATIAALLELEPVAPDRFRSRHNDANFDGEIFGGQYLGQALWAALRTADGYAPHTLYGFFLRAADAALPLGFAVERTREGRRFAHRRVTVEQGGREVFRAEVSLHMPADDQPEHQRPMPAAPPPEHLVSLRDLAIESRAVIGATAAGRLTGKALFDTFPVEPAVGMGLTADEPRTRHWAKAVTGALDASTQYAALAYLSDIMANMASRALHTPHAFDRSLGALSLNHGIWFHRPPRTDDWLLLDHESCHAGGGLGTSRGLIYGRDGALFASIMQDAMIRRS